MKNYKHQKHDALIQCTAAILPDKRGAVLISKVQRIGSNEEPTVTPVCIAGDSMLAVHTLTLRHALLTAVDGEFQHCIIEVDDNALAALCAERPRKKGKRRMKNPLQPIRSIQEMMKPHSLRPISKQSKAELLEMVPSLLKRGVWTIHKILEDSHLIGQEEASLN